MKFAKLGFVGIAGLLTAATPPPAAPLLLTCKVAGEAKMTIYMTDGSRRHPDARIDQTETYQIDLANKSVTRTSISGTRYKYDGTTEPINAGAGFFTDVRSASETLIVFCTDTSKSCAPVTTVVNDSEALGKTDPVVIDLSRMTIAYASHIEAKTRSTGHYAFISDTTYAGTCTRG